MKKEEDEEEDGQCIQRRRPGQFIQRGRYARRGAIGNPIPVASDSSCTGFHDVTVHSGRAMRFCIIFHNCCLFFVFVLQLQVRVEAEFVYNMLGSEGELVSRNVC